MLPLRSLGPMIVILLIVGLSPYSPVGISSIHRAHAATRNVSLVGYASTGWNGSQPSGPNPTITITQGDTLVITTSQGDTLPHHFFVDVDKDPVNPMSPDCTVDKCATAIPPTSTDTLTGFTQGTYFYYCEYHSTMKGTFVVQAGPDFSITSNPSSLTMGQGTSQTSTLTISSLNGFSGTVTFSAPSVPTGITASLNSSTVTVGPSSKTLALNVTVGGATAPGSYSVTVTGSASTSHSVTLTVTVTSASSPATGLPGSLLVLAAVAVLAVIVVIAILILRRKPAN